MKNIEPKWPVWNNMTIFISTDATEAEILGDAIQVHQVCCQLDAGHVAGFTGTSEVSMVGQESEVPAAVSIAQRYLPRPLRCTQVPLFPPNYLQLPRP